MLKIWEKTLWKYQTLKYSHRILFPKSYATFSPRDILHETSDEAGTLLTRFAKQVAFERLKVCDLVATRVRYSDYFPLSDMRYFQEELKKTDQDQISNVITYAFTYRSNADPAKFAIVLNELDRHAVNNVDEMTTDTILRTLYAFLFLMPNWITRLDFYYRAIQRLYENFNKQELKSKEYFVQLCFYIGLNKKQSNNLNSLLNSLLDNHICHHLNEMSTLDIALVSNSAFKTSTIIKSEDFNQRLIAEVLNISETSNGNDALLVNFVKSMRLQRLRSAKVCEHIENICKDAEKLQNLQVRGQVHLFAYLAENLWDSEPSILPLTEAIIEKLKLCGHDSWDQAIRGKDISTFLWSCAQLNCRLSTNNIVSIENVLLEKYNAGEFKNFPDQLVDSCLSLWILGHKSRELFQASVNLKHELGPNRTKPKVESRLTVLLSAAKIEEPTWCSAKAKDFEAFSLKSQVPPYLGNQDGLYEKFIGELVKEENVLSANILCPINGINIPGILVKLSPPNEGDVFLEFIAPTQTLHFSQEPFAILRLKIRLLQSIGYKTKLVPSSDILNPQRIRNAFSNNDEQEGHIKELPKTSIST